MARMVVGPDKVSLWVTAVFAPQVSANRSYGEGGLKSSLLGWGPSVPHATDLALAQSRPRRLVDISRP